MLKGTKNDYTLDEGDNGTQEVEVWLDAEEYLLYFDRPHMGRWRTKRKVLTLKVTDSPRMIFPDIIIQMNDGKPRVGLLEHLK